MASTRVPVTVLTGFLGAGKTTLLNYVLQEHHGRRIAVVENEFGEVGIDQALVEQADEEIFEMNNGCVCCTVRGDLVRILSRLLRRSEPLDAIIIETTGVADPSPVAQTFFFDDQLRDQLELDAIVTLVDAKHVLLHLDEAGETGEKVVEQIAFADRIVVTKTDLVDQATADRVVGRVREVNATAEVLRADHGQLDLDRILGVHAFDLDRVVDIDPSFLDQASLEAHEHDDGIVSVGLDVAGDLDAERLRWWLDDVVTKWGTEIFRMKGILAVAGDERRLVFQGVHMQLDTRPGAAWAPGDERRSRLCFIGRDLDRQELEASLTGCLVDDGEGAGVGVQPAVEPADTAELRRVVREELGLGDDDTLTVTERACPKQGCPPVETVISVFPAADEAYLIRVCKAIGDVEPIDVIASLAWGDHPYSFDPRSMF